jgi:predicted aldo/keto reductase-like oxidoreductase
MLGFKGVSDMPKLGFGTMRLPVLPGTDDIDIALYKAMVDTYMSRGFNYFDTAYMYHGSGSERAFKEAVAGRYARSSYCLVTKLPIWACETEADLDRVFNEQMDRTGAGYFDFYLHHCLNAENDEKTAALGGYDFVKNLKESGKIGHIGFSFHGGADALKKILLEQPQMEFAQLQLNYLDFEGEAGEFYRIARERGIPIVVMEPVRGGALHRLPKAAAELLAAANPEASFASWAIRWCAGLPGVVTVLSGMSDMAQMEDNIKTIENFRPLDERELETVRKAAGIIREIKTVPCTNCKYCENCPSGVKIPELFAAYNTWIGDKNFYTLGTALDNIPAGSRAGDCAACGACEAACPQDIPIIERLKEFAHIAGR